MTGVYQGRSRFADAILFGGSGSPVPREPDVRSGHPWPSLTRCLLRFAILASLANNAGSAARATPRWKPDNGAGTGDGIQSARGPEGWLLPGGGRARIRGPWMAANPCHQYRP